MNSYTCCPINKIPEVDILSMSSVLKLVSEPNRMRILFTLLEGEEHCVCEFNEHMTNISQSLLSHHLADLKSAGLIVSEKKGLRVYYRMTDEGLRVAKIILETLKKG